MAEVFADTSGWASWLIQNDPHHPLASTLLATWQGGGQRVITTNYVLTELAALLTSPLRVPRPVQIPLLQAMRTASWVDILHIDSTLDAQAWALFEARPDKEWSLVDCASFVVMQQRGIAEALTADHHFEQAGFVRLLK
jgi:predicted nucleic acid-binding protein